MIVVDGMTVCLLAEFWVGSRSRSCSGSKSISSHSRRRRSIISSDSICIFSRCMDSTSISTGS